MANGDSILEKQKSVPNLFNQHIVASSRHNLKYSLFAYLMDPFVKLFEDKVSQINSADMVKTSSEWVPEKMSISEMRKNIYQRLVTLSTDTNILEDPANTCLEIQKHYEKKQQDKVPDKAFFTTKSSNFISIINEDFYEAFFEVYYIFVRQKLAILGFSF